MSYKIKGIVIKGEGYGRKLGFPTVNLDSKTKELPPEGVYAGVAILDKKKYRAGIVIGPEEKIEAHMRGYRDNAYGKVVVLEIKKFIRPFRKFKTEKELIEQIGKDLKMC